MKIQKCMKNLLVLGCLLSGFCQTVAAVEVAGVKFEDTIKMANKDLKLNGAGVRTKAIFKVYAAGLYLPEKKNNVADILALQGPRRVMLVMLREMSPEDLGNAFMAGLNANSDKAEKTKIINQTLQFGEIFAGFPPIKKGDVLTFDWVPGSGSQCTLNGKRIGEIIQDVLFYNAVLKIWIGDKPADSALKPLLLGEKTE